MLTIAGLLLSFACTGLGGCGYEAAQRSWETGDTRVAIARYRELDAWGEARAQLALARLHRTGEGVAADPARAAALYREAASAGISEAMTALGDLHMSGLGVPQDPAMAVRWYEAAAGTGPIPPAAPAEPEPPRTGGSADPAPSVAATTP